MDHFIGPSLDVEESLDSAFLWSGIIGNTINSSSASASATPWVCSIVILDILIDFAIDHYLQILRIPYIGA